MMPLKLHITVHKEILRSSVIKRGRLGLTPPHLCVCPKPGPGFPTSYVVGFFCVFSEWKWEVIVHIGGIVDHHCLNFLFIISWRGNKYTSIEKLKVHVKRVPVAWPTNQNWPIGLGIQISFLLLLASFTLKLVFFPDMRKKNNLPPSKTVKVCLVSNLSLKFTLNFTCICFKLKHLTSQIHCQTCLMGPSNIWRGLTQLFRLRLSK